MSLARHRVCFSTNLPRGGWVGCATTGSMHAKGDRVFGRNLQGFRSTCTQSGPSSEGRSDIGFVQGQHRQALHTKGAVTQRQGSRALADEEQVAEAAQPGSKGTGLMKRSRACVVDPSPGVFFHQPPTGRMGGLFVPPQVACTRTE